MENLFTSFKIADLEIKNRFVMCAMAGMRLYNFNGLPEQNVYEYYVERAKGGVGLIITRAITVLPIGLDAKLYEHPEYFLPLKKLVDEVHKYNCKIFIQLSAGGGRIIQNIEGMKRKGISEYDMLFAPSDDIPNAWFPEIKHRGMTYDEICEYINAFGKMSKIAKDIGFDGVEVHAVHEGFLLDQFTLECTNHRTDEFGGNLENRFRFPCEIIKNIKKSCGDRFPVSLRYSVISKMKSFNYGAMPNENYKEFGRDISEAIEGAKILEAAGCDMLNTDNGSHDSWYWAHPPIYMPDECNITETSILKKHINIPVICAGKMDNIKNIKECISDNLCDGIGIARALLVDPEFVNKIKNNNFDDIKPCIGCHSGCLYNITNGMELSCALNPKVLNEKYYESVSSAEVKKKIAIIGGGIAGMETAILLKTRGHEVVIYEKSDRMGGIFNTAAKPKFKARNKALLDWYKNRINSLKIDIIFNTEINVDDINNMDCDAVVIAIGAKRKCDFEDNQNFSDVISFIDNYKQGEYKDILVVGGNLSGCEIAYMAAKDGTNVTILEESSSILNSKKLCNANKLFLIDAFRTYGVNIKCNTKLIEVESERAVISSENDETEIIPFDCIVFASENRIATKEVFDKNKIEKEVYYVGEVNSVGNIKSVVQDAYKVAYTL